MSDPVQIPWFKDIFIWLIGGVVTLLSFIGKRQINRIDKLEDDKVDRKEYDGTINRLSGEIKETRTEISKQIKDETSEITQRLDTLMLHVSDMKKK